MQKDSPVRKRRARLLKCSFAKMSTKGTFEPIWPYGTDLYGRFLYLESGTERVLIAAFDLSGSPPREAARWRRRSRPPDRDSGKIRAGP